MTSSGERTTGDVQQMADESVERILGAAAPREVPLPEEAAAIRQAVHAEWQKVAGRKKRRRSLASFALAASVLLAVFVTFNSMRTTGIGDVQVASISKTFGSLYVLGENAELLAGDNLNNVFTGQVLITDEESGVSLEWDGGGSLRVDAKTRLEFTDSDSVYLHSGRVYFDSQPDMFANSASAQANPSPATAVLTIRTDHGAVSHVGTQYMAQAGKASLTVSVREGEVLLRTDASQNTARRGEQLQLRGNGNVNRVNIKIYGAPWQWTEQLSPQLEVEGRPIDEFLRWVEHETGLRLDYENVVTERHAREKVLIGRVSSDPLNELRLRMLTANLDWRIEDGVIRVAYLGDEYSGEQAEE